ncbi:MAG: fibronectin type III domain-containing protein [Bacteroidetes bacterium]|nr:fibronectin type III domain-containing protein [Bacteroidota bacterium]
MKKYFLLLLALGLFRLLSAQDVFVRAAVYKDTAYIRWVPASYEVWKTGIQQGYIVERFTLDAYMDLGANAAGKGTVLTTQPLKPLAKADAAWNTLKQREPLAALVYDEIYASKPLPADAAKRKTAQEISFGYAMKACDYSPDVAAAHGLMVKDANVQRGEVYVYLVYVNNSPALKPGMGKADPKTNVAPAVAKPAIRGGNRFAMLSFDAAATRNAFAGYIIERSADSVRFERMNKNLLVFAVSDAEQNKTELYYKDSLPQNGKPYWYRVRGWSYFGFEGAPSAAVRVRGKEEWTAYPEIDSCFSADNKTAQLRWKIPSALNTQQLKHFTVLRGGNAGGPFAPVKNAAALPPVTTLFTDAAPEFTNYYVVAAISNDGDTAFSYPALLQLADEVPPAAPENVTGIIDSNGVVQLKWNAVNATDLRGYRVFRCNSLNEEFVEITDTLIAATRFRDSVATQTLTRDVFYTVRAVDRVYNNSPDAKPARLKRPDKVAPVAPVFISAVHNDSAIVLRWIRSSSSDVSEVKLLRTAAGKQSVLVSTFRATDTTTHFTDTQAPAGADYIYQLICTDSSGNKSTSASPQVIFRPRIRVALKDVNVKLDTENKQVTISWAAPAEEVDRYIIYRATENQPMRTFETLPGNSATFTDSRVSPGNTYQYRIKAIYKSGAETELSPVRVVTY